MRDGILDDEVPVALIKLPLVGVHRAREREREREKPARRAETDTEAETEIGAARTGDGPGRLSVYSQCLLQTVLASSLVAVSRATLSRAVGRPDTSSR